MPDSDDENSHLFIFNLIDDPVIPDSNSIGIAVSQLSVSLRAGINGKRVDSVIDVRDFLIRQFFIIPHG